MIIVLSGFNGIESLVKDLYSQFDPDITFTPSYGKSFEMSQNQWDELKSVEGVEYCYPVIEEITMIKHDEQYLFATMKGVPKDYFESGIIDRSIYDGESQITDDLSVIVGYGVQGRLQVAANDMYDNKVKIYGLLRSEKLNHNNEKAFKPKDAYVRGVFSVNPQFDNQYFLVSLDFANDLLEYEGAYSKFEIKVKEGYDPFEVKSRVLDKVGSSFFAKTRYEMNEVIFKTNEAEKWMVFLILGFIMIISTFNIVASLSMLILDKKKDIMTLISMGATHKMIKNIFITEGLLINFFGAFLGGLVGFLVCIAQIKYHFVTMENSVVDHWPVIVKWQDLVLILSTVLVIGLVSSIVPVNYLIKRHFSQMFNRA